MDNQTMLAYNLDAAAEMARYDAQCKKLMSYKSILAYILTSVTEEFRGMEPREAEKYIGDTTISSEAVDPDTPDMVVGEATENFFTDERTRFYDIRFRAARPDDDGGAIELIINLEAHNITENLRVVLKRGMYYCSRLVSGQYGTEFKNSDYDRLKKVYSIWVCIGTDSSVENTVVQYRMQPEVLFGEYRDTPEKRVGYDLMSLIIIGLGADSKNMDGVVGLLGTLLLDNDIKNKKSRLNDSFGIPMTETFDKEAFDMCNLSSYFVNRGIQKGRQEGKLEGKKEGRQEERSDSIRRLVSGGIMTAEKAADFYSIPVEEVRKICAEDK